jgi:hypothetical protein
MATLAGVRQPRHRVPAPHVLAAQVASSGRVMAVPVVITVAQDSVEGHMALVTARMRP